MELLLWLIFFLTPLAGHMSLDYFIYQPSGAEEYETNGPLRGVVPGNIFNPPEPGMAKLRCGGLGNRNHLGSRVEIAAGDAFKIQGTIHRNIFAKPKLEFTIRWGDNPNFWKSGYSLLPQPYEPDIVSTPYIFRLSLKLPLESYSYNATVQVEFFDRDRYIQCVDITVINGQPIPEGVIVEPDGITLGAKAGGSSGVSLPPTPAKPQSGLTTLQIVMIALAVVVILLFIPVYLCYKRGQEKAEDRQPELVPSEKTQRVPERTMRPAEEAEVEIEEEEQEDSNVDEVDQPDYGDSKEEAAGHSDNDRHFHFKYIEDMKIPPPQGM